MGFRKNKILRIARVQLFEYFNLKEPPRFRFHKTRVKWVWDGGRGLDTLVAMYMSWLLTKTQANIASVFLCSLG
jgi:hypothetical protein